MKILCKIVNRTYRFIELGNKFLSQPIVFFVPLHGNKTTTPQVLNIEFKVPKAPLPKLFGGAPGKKRSVTS